jgi:Uma2 family endonuclease
MATATESVTSATTATATEPAATPQWETAQDLVDALGNIPLSRIRMTPLPGRATDADLLEQSRHHHRLCELVDGVLVEKAMGFRESLLACALIEILRAFVVPPNLGLVSGADGMLRLFPGLVRAPDVAYVSWDRLPGRKIPEDPIPTLVPDLAIEVLSASNTKKEMERKRGEYFSQGVSLVWEVDPVARTVTVYTPDGAKNVLTQPDRLDGGHVLPGFSLPLSELFGELDRHG